MERPADVVEAVATGRDAGGGGEMKTEEAKSLNSRATVGADRACTHTPDLQSRE
jgi:hypothetical protein